MNFSISYSIFHMQNSQLVLFFIIAISLPKFPISLLIMSMFPYKLFTIALLQSIVILPQ